MEPLKRELGAAAAAVETETETEAEAEAEAKVDILQLLHLRDKMKQQLMDYSTAAHASQQESYADHVVEEKFITNATQDLEREMEEVKTSFHNKTLALQRMQVTAALRNKMKQNDDDSRLILETVKHIVALSQAVLEHHQQTREKEQNLIDIKRKRHSLKKAAGQKLLQTHTMMIKQKEEEARVIASKMLEKLCNKLQKERERTAILQSVFQNVVIGSRVNWAEDPSLRAIVLQLEKNVYFL